MADAALIPRHVPLRLSPVEGTDMVMLYRAAIREFDLTDAERERYEGVLAALEDALEPKDDTGRPMGNLPQLRQDDEDGGSAVAV